MEGERECEEVDAILIFILWGTEQHIFYHQLADYQRKHPPWRMFSSVCSRLIRTVDQHSVVCQSIEHVNFF